MQFNNMDRATLDEHREDFLHCYPNSLSATAQEFGVCCNEGIPFTELQNQAKKYSAQHIYSTLLKIINASQTLRKHEIFTTKNCEFWNCKQAMRETCRQSIFFIIEEAFDRGFMDLGDL